jgi:hypothetical protein
MLLPFSDSLVVTSKYDPEMSMLADRHYSRRTVGARQFLFSGKTLAIRDHAGLILFGWYWCKDGLRFDDQTGYNCAIFRNESSRRSSEVILECEDIAIREWGPSRMFTYIDPSKIRSVNPGYCFKQAGWKFLRKTPIGKHLLIK